MNALGAAWLRGCVLACGREQPQNLCAGPGTSSGLCGRAQAPLPAKDRETGVSKGPLTGQSNRQRIGYQLLVDDTGPAFVDLHLADIEDPRLGLVDAFLALAWACPVTIGPRQGQALGLPNVLSVPAKLLNVQDQSQPQQLAAELNLDIQAPQSGLESDVHRVKAPSRAFDSILCDDRLREMSWAAPAELEYLSVVAAAFLSADLSASAPRRGLSRHPFRKPTYQWRALPEGWLRQVAQTYGFSSEQAFLDIVHEYFEWARR